MKYKGYSTNCHQCGRFHNIEEIGASSVFVPDSDVSYEELYFQCAKCTTKYGAAMPRQNVVIEVCQHINRE